MFEVHKIELKDNRPDRVTLTLPIEFLAHVTSWVGHTPPNQFPHESFHGFYDAMTSTVFNTFWENGVNGCIDGDED